MRRGRKKRDKVQLATEMLAIIALGPITMRSLARKFCAPARPTIEQLCRTGIEYKQLTSTGTGVKGSPITISLTTR